METQTKKTELYISTTKELHEIISERKSKALEIQKTIDQWINDYYGIIHFSDHIHKYYNLISSENTRGSLCRQIGGISIEDITIYFLSKELGLDPFLVTFYEDMFTCKNNDKKARVKIPWIEWSKKQNMILEYEALFHPLNNLDGLVLSKIQTPNESIREYHRQKRNGVFRNVSDYLEHDVSALYTFLYHNAKKKSDHVYVQNELGFSVKKYGYIPRYGEHFRPPASWYYPLYFSCFLDGSMILFETYENEEGGVPEARILFEKTMIDIYNNIGLYPIIVEIPPLSPEMLYCNKHLLQYGAFESLSAQICKQKNTEKTIKERAYTVAQTIINFR